MVAEKVNGEDTGKIGERFLGNGEICEGREDEGTDGGGEEGTRRVGNSHLALALPPCVSKGQISFLP